MYANVIAIETGVFFEALNFSLVKDLPVVFICENNSYSVYTEINATPTPKIEKFMNLLKKVELKHFFSEFQTKKYITRY